MLGTVYLVDDDASVRRGLDRLLRSAGYRVEVFESAAQYLAHEVEVQRSCLLLDIRMPRFSGFELQGTIAGTAHEKPIVFITGHGDEEVRTRALASGAVDVLFKPVDATVLVEAIERALCGGSARRGGIA